MNWTVTPGVRYESSRGRDLPFYSRQVVTLGLRYERGPWIFNADAHGVPAGILRFLTRHPLCQLKLHLPTLLSVAQYRVAIMREPE